MVTPVKHGSAFGMKQKVMSSSSDYFCVKNLDTFSRAYIRGLKMNVVACAEGIFQMLTLQTNYFFRQSIPKQVGSSSSNNMGIWHESECWGFKSPWIKTFSVSKISTISQKHPLLSRQWILLPVRRCHFKYTFTKKYHGQIRQLLPQLSCSDTC